MTAKFRRSEEYVPAAWEGNVVALMSSVERDAGVPVYLAKQLAGGPHIEESVLGVCQRDPDAEFWVVNAASHQVIGCARAREEWAALNGYPGYTEVPSAFWRTVDPRSK
jgi:hypothetical protein